MLFIYVLMHLFIYLNPYPRTYFLILEREEGRGRERERHINQWPPNAPWSGIEPAT